MIIAIEGIDGSGKGTQARLLVDNLIKDGIKAVLFSFPSYDKTFFGRMIGEYLRGEFGTLEQVHPRLATVLYANDRLESMKNMRKYLDDGYVVVCDRYTDSNIAHQVSKLTNVEEMDEMERWLDEMEFEILGIERPTMTLFLDVPHNVTRELVLLKDTRTYTTEAEDIHESNYDYLVKTGEVYNRLCKKRGWKRINCLDDEGNLKPLNEIQIMIRKEIGI